MPFGFVGVAVCTFEGEHHGCLTGVETHDVARIVGCQSVFVGGYNTALQVVEARSGVEQGKADGIQYGRLSCSCRACDEENIGICQGGLREIQCRVLYRSDVVNGQSADFHGSGWSGMLRRASAWRNI